MNNAKISFSGYSISAKTYVKYLGVLLDNKLSQQHGRNFVVNKLCIAIGVFSKLKYYVPQRVLV